MPNIRSYTNPVPGITPSDRGVSATAQAAEDTARGAARVSEMMRQTGTQIGNAITRGGAAIASEYERQVEHVEVTQSATLLATKQDELTRGWNNIASKANPNDTTVSQKFREEQLEPTLQKYIDGHKTETGKRFAEKEANRLREHFLNKTTADTALRAGQALVSNLDTLLNTSSNIVSIDPSSLETIIARNTAAVREMVASAPNLAPGTAGQVETQLLDKLNKNTVQAAVQGMARANPEATIKALEDGRFNKWITGEEKTVLMNYVRTVQNVARVAANLDRVKAEHNMTTAVKTGAAKAFSDNAVIDEDGTLTLSGDFARDALKLVETYPAAGLAMATSMLSAMRAINNDAERGVKTVTDPFTHEDFRTRGFLKADDPKRLTLAEVYQARADGKLGDKDFTFWEKQVNSDLRDPKIKHNYQQLNEFFSGIKPSITKSTPFAVNDLGERNFLRFKQDMTDKFEQLQKIGVPIDQMLRENGGYSFWRDIPRYVANTNQAVQAIIDKSKPGGGVPADLVEKPANFSERFNSPIPRWKPGMTMEELAGSVGARGSTTPAKPKETPNFKTLEEAYAALKRGEIDNNAEVMVGGKRTRVYFNPAHKPADIPH